MESKKRPVYELQYEDQETIEVVTCRPINFQTFLKHYASKVPNLVMVSKCKLTENPEQYPELTMQGEIWYNEVTDD